MINPDPPDIHFADGPVFRIDAKEGGEPRRVEVDGLESGLALAIPSSGQLFVADQNRKVVFHVKRGERIPIDTITHPEFKTLYSLAYAADRRGLLIGHEGVFGDGAVFLMPVPRDGAQPVPIWKARQRGGSGVYVDG